MSSQAARGGEFDRRTDSLKDYAALKKSAAGWRGRSKRSWTTLGDLERKEETQEANATMGSRAAGGDAP